MSTPRRFCQGTGTVSCRAVLAATFVAGALLAGCKTDSDSAAKPCCDQPQIPAGVVPFRVVDEETSGTSDGQKVILRVALGKPAKRDEIYPILHTLYRHAMTRGPFEPIHFIADVYPSEATAKAAGDTQLLARISREQSQIAPRCENRVGYDFAEQVDRAFAASLGRAKEENLDDTCRLDTKKPPARFDEGFTHKPTYTLDAEQKAVTVTYPYLEMGKDEYTEELKLTSALIYWIEHVTSLFKKVPDLKAVTFKGIHKDAEVLNISLSRQQFDTDFAGLQETIAAHAAVTFQAVGTGRSSDKAAEQEQETFKLKTYKEALTALPKSQVTIAPALASGKLAKPAAKGKGKGKAKG